MHPDAEDVASRCESDVAGGTATFTRGDGNSGGNTGTTAAATSESTSAVTERASAVTGGASTGVRAQGSPDAGTDASYVRHGRERGRHHGRDATVVAAITFWQLVPPPGFESLAPAAAPSHRADVSADWSHVDSTIASFLESTADTIEDDDPFIMAARSSNYDDIFSARISDVDITPRLPTSSDNNHAAKKVGTKVSAQPPLPPTPHPEVLAAVLGDVI